MKILTNIDMNFSKLCDQPIPVLGMDKILFRKTGSMVYPPMPLMKRGLEALLLYFVIKINVVLLKRKRWTQCDDCKEDFRGEE